jgi:hypothetical protein
MPACVKKIQRWNPSPWGVLGTLCGEGGGIQTELVKLAALPRYQWAIPALKYDFQLRSVIGENIIFVC